ncbi:hypothetical protein HII13_002570 [Brettanomyces bruxellensis]|nr:hypothetical protein HII13_002570 [Brettanomyces bruxellensis]
MAAAKKFDVDVQQNTSSEESDFQKNETDFSSMENEDLKGPAQIGKLHRLIKLLEIRGTEHLSSSQLFLYNEDLRPLEEKRRLWSWFNFVCFWLADSVNLNTLQIASTAIDSGLSFGAAWGTVWLGYFIVGCFITLAGRIGTFYHISFPVSCRSSFGIWGSLWPVINRVFMACVWFGVQSSIGGQCMQLMLKAIFGNDLDTRIHDTIHSDAIDSFGVLSFFIFWICQLPFIYMHPHTVRHLFTVKALICPFAAFGFLIWTMAKAGGAGPVVRQPSKVHGSTLAWTFIKATMNSLANFSTLVINDPDFTRMSKTPRSATWSQLLTIPICFSITCLIGILVSSASTILYGTTYWDPLDVLERFLDSEKSGSRAGVFFVALGFALAQVGTNISANSISAGTDMTALLPKFMNIRRGGFICAFIGFAICPWNLLTSSSMFTTYLSAYAVFLSAIAGVVFCDYYICKKGCVILRDLYVADNSSKYYFWHGINLRAYAAYICGILPNIVGFVGATGHTVPVGASYVYDLSFITGYLSSAAVYLVLNLIWPSRANSGKIFEKKWLEEWQEVEDFDEFFRLKYHGVDPEKVDGTDVLTSV